uniref:Major facilitator superfamily (MFS) profile domain-containing protein n=1 Tax=Fagus sylvatica TaxID=28930 RepID=A0A2N9IR53_FAGSY
MAAIEFQESSYTKDGIHSSNEEAQMSDTLSKRGGWITFPFITGTLMGLTLAAGGWGTNLVVYLIEKFQVKSIVATKIGNIVNGSTNLLPVLAAIIADSLLGCFSVIWISSSFSLLGILLLALTATLKSLRPQTCENGSSLCPMPSKIQFSVLYLGIVLASIGLGGTRFTIAAMGANQFDKAKDQASFFNWYVIILYASAVLGATVIVYIEDSFSWALGFSICVVVTLIGLAIFLLGNRYYRHVKPEGSPFTSLARVIVTAIRKRKIPISSRSEDYYSELGRECWVSSKVDYYSEHAGKVEKVASVPTKSFRFLNRAALKAEGDTNSDSSIAKPWRLCSVQQVEDLKSLMRYIPNTVKWHFLEHPYRGPNELDSPASSNYGSPPTTTFQNPSRNRDSLYTNLYSYLSHPHRPDPLSYMAEAVSSVSYASPTDSTWPCVQRLRHVGCGSWALEKAFHYPGQVTLYYQEFTNITSKHESTAMYSMIMGIAYYMSNAVIALTQRTTGCFTGIGEAFHYPGQVTLYYQEFPTSLRSTSTAMYSMIMGIAYYMSNAVIALTQRTTGWLPDNINNGRLDKVYWMLLVVGVINFGYYLICAKFYRYQNVAKENEIYVADK